MDRTLIQAHTSGIIKGLIERTESIKSMEQRTVKGTYREIFVSNLLRYFLPSNFDVGTGIIVNQRGDESSQIDVNIYDKSFLPPFIKEQNLGVFPAETVLAVVEVRSRIDNDVLKELDKKLGEVNNKIYHKMGSIYADYTIIKPFFTVFGFYSNTQYALKKKGELRNWIWDNCKDTTAICLLDEFSWFNLNRDKGKNHLKLKDDNNEETKSFFALLLDNIITLVKMRNKMETLHRDYFSIYLRDQSGIRKRFQELSLL